MTLSGPPPTTLRAVPGTARPWLRRRRDGQLRQQREDFAVMQGDQPPHGFHRQPAVRSEEAEVPHFLKAARQHVLEKTPQELQSVDRHSSPTLCAAGAIRKRHAAVAVRNDAVVADCYAKHVRRQIP